MDKEKTIESWQAIYNQLYQPLCYFSLEFVKDFEKAEDIVQNTLFKLWKKGLVFEDIHHAKNYLYRSVRNASLNKLKSEEVRSKVIAELREEISKKYFQEDQFDIMVKAELYKRILDAINSLPIQSAKVFNLAYIEHKSNPEIAELLSISVNTVKVHKNSAKIKLRKLLKDLSPSLSMFFYLVDL